MSQASDYLENKIVDHITGTRSTARFGPSAAGAPSFFRRLAFAAAA